MHRISTGLTACLVAAVVTGCGTVHAGQSGSPGHTNAPGTPATAAAGPRAAAATPPTVAGCHSVASLITQADSGKTYCVRVGHTVDIFLHSTQGDLWLQPLASSGVLKPVPNGAASLVAGATEGSFAAVQPGRAFVTSVRPPCQVPVSGAKGGLEPSDTIPRSYPLRLCPAANRFSVWIIVES
jgi:hypothetical protein